MVTRVTGTVTSGYHVAGDNLSHVLHLIEARSGLSPLIPNTFNLQLNEKFPFSPTFVVTREEYGRYNEELWFRHCEVEGIRCIVMRPDSHAAGQHHGRAYLELMSTVRLRESLQVEDGATVDVDVD